VFDAISLDVMSSLLQVVMIDLALAGDNAVVIGLAAAGLPASQRKRAIAIGIAAATILRILLATVTTELLDVIGLLLAGGLLLLWVCWKMFGELQALRKAALVAGEAQGHLSSQPGGATKSLRQAAVQILVADLSMSLDNVLAVAGAAREHPGVLIFGLAVSIGMMGLASNYIARLLQRHQWIAYLGLIIILYVSLDMIWRGTMDLAPHVASLY